MIEKALKTGADEVVLDLEDAVAAGSKAQARTAAVAALGGPRGASLAVRVNALDSPWGRDDLAALAGTIDPPGSVVLPKVEAPEDIVAAEQILAGGEAGTGARRPVRIQALIETARGLSNAVAIATSSPRLDSLIIGYADLSVSLARRAELSDPSWDAARHTVLVASKAAGLHAIDGPHLGVLADDRFLTSARRARELGFDGKWAIHPRQIDALNSAFSPSPGETAEALRIVHALQGAEARGDGATALDDQMLDEATRRWALEVLASSEACRPSQTTTAGDDHA